MIKPLNENEDGRLNHIQVQESITQEKGINIPHVRCTQW